MIWSTTMTRRNCTIMDVGTPSRLQVAVGICAVRWRAYNKYVNVWWQNEPKGCTLKPNHESFSRTNYQSLDSDHSNTRIIANGLTTGVHGDVSHRGLKTQKGLRLGVPKLGGYLKRTE
jgi:hypothetical protein